MDLSWGAEKLGAIGALDRSRTYDLRFRKPTLYPLSYEGLRARLSVSVRLSWSDQVVLNVR